MALVSYDTGVRTEWGLTKMNAEGKASARAILKNIRGGSMTNLSGGLLAGIDELKKATNDVKSVLLLTDGLANHGVTNAASINSLVQSALVGSLEACTVFTFGYGADHDQEMLRSISDSGKGVYYFVEELDDVPTAFADCLGGLLSVVAQNVTITCEVPAELTKKGVTIKKVHTTKKVDTLVEGHKVEVALGDIYAQEERDLMVELQWPAEALSGGSTADQQQTHATLVDFSLRYANILSCKLCESSAAVEVTRCTSAELATAISHGQQQQNVAISRAHARIAAATAMDEARKQADSGSYDQARTTIDQVLLTVNRSKTIGEEDLLVDNLLEQLTECSEQMQGASQWQTKGRFITANYAQGHHCQRSNASKVSAKKSAYRNASKQMRCVSSEAVKGSSYASGGSAAGSAGLQSPTQMSNRQMLQQTVQQTQVHQQQRQRSSWMPSMFLSRTSSSQSPVTQLD
jgi:hypothetical protein